MWIILAALAAVCQASTDALYKKNLRNTKLNGISLCLGTYIFAVLFLLPIALLNVPEHIGKPFYYIIPVIGVLDSLAMFFYMKSLQTGDLGNVIPLQTTTPLFALFFAPLFLDEHITIIGVIGILLMTLGIYCLNIKDLKKNYFSPFKSVFTKKENRYMLTTALIWSFTTCLHKIGMQNSNPVFWLLFARIPLLIFFLIVFILKKENFNVIKNNLHSFTTLGFLNAITSYFYYISFLIGITVYAMVIKRTSVLISIALGAYLYKELNVKEHVIGATIMIAGCLCIAI